MSQGNEIKLQLSETAKVRPGVFRAAVSIVYAGMLNEEVYSLVITWSHGHNSMAYNLFIPLQQKEVLIPKGRIKVEYVSPEEIRFHYVDE
jgi:hypothetical protein